MVDFTIIISNTVFFISPKCLAGLFEWPFLISNTSILHITHIMLCATLSLLFSSADTEAILFIEAPTPFAFSCIVTKPSVLKVLIHELNFFT